MRIAMVTPYSLPNIGGIEKVVHALSKELVAKGNEVHVVTTNLQFPSTRFRELENTAIDGVYVHRIRVLARTTRFFSYPSKGGAIFVGLAKMLNLIKPDIIHFHNIGAPLLGYMAYRYAKKNSVKFVFHPYYHDKYPFTVRNILLNYMGSVMKRSDLVITATQIERDQLVAKYALEPNRIKIIPYGVFRERLVDDILYQQLREEYGSTKNILYVGRIEENKGIRYLLSAIEIVQKTLDVKLFIIGRGDLSAFQGYIDTSIGKANIVFLGEVDEQTLNTYYKFCDLFTSATLYESFGMIFVEAMSNGKPIVTTRVGAVPEVVQDEVGLLVPPRRSDELAYGIVQILTNQQAYEEMSRQGYQKAQEFYWDSIAVQYLEEYRRLTETR